ncbi:MAG: hypothetical protein RIF41_36660, partial [Polyangiaceae bacterium]
MLTGVGGPDHARFRDGLDTALCLPAGSSVAITFPPDGEVRSADLRVLRSSNTQVVLADHGWLQRPSTPADLRPYVEISDDGLLVATCARQVVLRKKGTHWVIAAIAPLHGATSCVAPSVPPTSTPAVFARCRSAHCDRLSRCDEICGAG